MSHQFSVPQQLDLWRGGPWNGGEKFVLGFCANLVTYLLLDEALN